MIILVLSLILLLIKRLKIMRETKRFHLEHFRQVAEPEGENDHEDQRQPHPTFGDGANSIFLVEIADADEVVEDGMERLNVEYTNTIAYRVPVDDFVKYHGIRRENQINEEEEFSKIPTGLMELYKVAVQKDNVSKNRYRYVYPYDFCRVVLNTSGEEGSNDYINACYVEGVEVERAYIAAQGPFTPETLDDFWKMAWQENSSRIVMLTNLFEGDTMKCLKYWPNDVMEFGDIVVRLESQEEYEMYTIRHMTMHQDDLVKAVTQFHFTGWPDRGVPETVDSLLRFRDLVKNDRPEQDGPIIIHCSAGIGRTGTFIALDYLLDEGAAKESVDVINCVSKLRQQRAHSIQTKVSLKSNSNFQNLT
uniref:protein-tyrosine-phosphatase n=1 Tax=Magallana gigas TaxID=29159 RepID=A0A8W8N3Q1_MAGGI